jgi:hypothetical protein
MKELILFAIKLCMVAALLAALYNPIKSSILEDRIYEAIFMECMNVRPQTAEYFRECRTWANHAAEGGRGIGQP